MKLYKISQDENNDYDTYSDAVVCAEDEEDAKKIHPSCLDIDEEGYFGYAAGTGNRTKFERYGSESWVANASHVKAEYIGKAKRGMKRGVVCASFHAG